MYREEVKTGARGGSYRPILSLSKMSVAQCKKCGRQYPRQRFTCVMQKIDAYRCQCGGKLEVFRISDS